MAAPYGEEAVFVAYLHDTAEDTEATIAEIESRFGPKIAACVSLLTDEPGSNRKERKAKTYAKLAQVRGPHELALVVKTTDRLACLKKVGESSIELEAGAFVDFPAGSYEFKVLGKQKIQLVNVWFIPQRYRRKRDA